MYKLIENLVDFIKSYFLATKLHIITIKPKIYKLIYLN